MPSIITGRNTTMNLSNPTDPVTITNLPFDASGNLIRLAVCGRGTRASVWRTPTQSADGAGADSLPVLSAVASGFER